MIISHFYYGWNKKLHCLTQCCPFRDQENAGTAVLFNNYVFHGNYPNIGTYPREALQLSYRPTWAGPAGEVEPWDKAEVAKLPPPVRELMGDRNARIWIYEGGNKPPNMPHEAPGMNPSRWERE